MLILHVAAGHIFVDAFLQTFCQIFGGKSSVHLRLRDFRNLGKRDFPKKSYTKSDVLVQIVGSTINLLTSADCLGLSRTCRRFSEH